MSLWSRLFRRGRDRDLDEEIQAHLAMAQRDRMERGESPEIAKQRAQLEFGNRTLVKEVTREMWGWSAVERLWQDLRYALRMLRRNPGFTAVAILSLSLGIGVNTAVFSLLDAVLVKSLPVAHPEQLRILTWIRSGGDNVGMNNHSGYSMLDDRGRRVDGSFSYPAYELLRRTLPQFSDLVAFAANEFTVTGGGTTDTAFGQYVSGNFFTGLGAEPVIGRPLLPDDQAAAVLTEHYWSKRFGSDPGIVGRIILVDRHPVTVAGVMRPSFQGLSPGRAVDLFVPMAMVPETARWYSLTENDNWWVQIFGRLRPEASDSAAANAVQSTLIHQIESYSGKKVVGLSVVLEPGQRGVGLMRGSLRTPIYILAVTAVLVVLIACVNLANLLLARYRARNREIAIRVSIGASRWRLMRQMLTESVLLGGLSAAGGLLIAKPMLRLLVRFLSGTALGLDASIDVRMFAFTFALAFLTALLFGTMPAWQASAVARSQSPRFSIGRYLVPVQVALSLVLLVGTGLFLRTILSLASVNLGFQTDNILTFQTDPGTAGYKAPQINGLYRRLEMRLAGIPGAEAVGMSQQALIAGSQSNGPVRLDGTDRTGKQTSFLYCSNSFLSVMRIPNVLGRGLTTADFDRDARIAEVNETFVKKYLPGRSPVGQIFYPPDWEQNGSGSKPVTIVGVVRDAHYTGVREEVPPVAYLPYGLRPDGVSAMTFVIRTHAAPMSLGPAVRKAVASIDGLLPVSELRTERDQIDGSLGRERMFAVLLSTFGAMALVLAAIGLYGVMALAVSRRTAEIGIRIALGARRSNVRWLLVRQGLIMASLGVIAGVPLALLLTGLVKSTLFGVKPNDPVSIGAAVIMMIVVAGLAAWVPARRASRVDPMVALRHE